MRMHYTYPAVLKKQNDAVVLSFPQFPEIKLQFESGNMEEIMNGAREALAETIYKMETKGMELPASPEVFSFESTEGEIVLLVGVHMGRYYLEQKSVKKTLTIPNWLNELAEEEGINFSHLLKQSLVEELRFRDGMIRERGMMGEGRGRQHLQHHGDREELRGRGRGHGRPSERPGHDHEGEPCDCGSDHGHSHDHGGGPRRRGPGRPSR